MDLWTSDSTPAIHSDADFTVRISRALPSGAAPQTPDSDPMIRWSTENSSFVSNRSQTRITAWQTKTMAALSLLALPMAGGAVRVDAGYARGREYSGLPFCPTQGLVLARARRGSTTTLREGREAQAGAETQEDGGTQEGGEPFFDRARCGAPCLAPDPTDEAFESRMRAKALLRFGAWMRFEAGTGRGRRTSSETCG